MSKKSRKRNKRLLALAGLIGVGMAAKNKRNASIDKGIKSAEDDSGSDMLSKKTNYITKKDTSKSDVAPVAEKVSVPVGKMKGAGTDESAIAGQKKRADYAKNSRINAVNTSEGPPSIDNPYNSRVIKGGRLGTVNYRKDGGRAKLKSGGRAGLRSGGKAIKKSMGKALRGGGKVMR